MDQLHKKYGQYVTLDFDYEKLKSLLEFRIGFLREELRETDSAISGDDVVDGMIDLCVVAISTLQLFGVDVHTAWDRVFEANMQKLSGVKPGRPNPLGLPDLIKPEGWVAPTHHDNIGNLYEVFRDRDAAGNPVGDDQ
jgi:hypothetical protein